MTHQSTIGERLGAPKHGYMGPKYREQTVRKSKDGDAARSQIKEYIAEHDGEIVTGKMLATVIEMTGANINYHMTQMTKHRVLSREKAGNGYRYWVGKRPVRDNGEVKTIVPPAPISQSTYATIEAAAWEFVRQSVSLAPHELGLRTKTMAEFLDHLKTKTPEQ